ncbi:DNA methyltransferase [Candidatus Flexifilum breve]|uniref:DNA methyltransferase n=1 Tax=Candidatus Flexifilum breve TaxID=3140694 RepID=UPI0031CCA1F5
MTEPMKTDAMFPDSGTPADQPVECLGQTFPGDAARRDHYLTRLRTALEELNAKLGGVTWTTVDDAVTRLSSLEHWALGDGDRLRELGERMREAGRGQGRGKDLLQLWKDEVGFPHGELDDILRLSDPPYYTVCPNPFLGEFIAFYGKPYDPATSDYRREPFAADVSEGKNDPIYNAHGYHTKVPYKAIMDYILHYTSPGDIVLDYFSGTGMTGVASQSFERLALETLPNAQFGNRHAILIELSPAATHIANSYNLLLHSNRAEFTSAVKRILREAEEAVGDLYSTIHSNGAVGRIDYTVWSEVFICSNCGHELVFWEIAVDHDKRKIGSDFQCPNCGVKHTKSTVEHALSTEFDPAIGHITKKNKKIPVLIVYKLGNKTFSKKPDETDLVRIRELDRQPPRWQFPTNRMMNTGNEIEKWGDEWRAGSSNFVYVHEIYTRRNSEVLGFLWQRINEYPDATTRSLLRFAFTGTCIGHSLMNRFRFDVSFPSNTTSGTMRITSLSKETNFLDQFKNKALLRIAPLLQNDIGRTTIISTQSATSLHNIPSNSVDYIFVDPPFGSNIAYAELNFAWEAWLRVFTSQSSEAIVSNAQSKGLLHYQWLMQSAFASAFRLLKPGRWMTVEFHNSQNAVWSAIQEALGNAGFVVADVRTLDKQMGTFKQVNSVGAVKQDLVISAYKPNGGLEERFRLEAGTENGVWDFVRTHLRQLPIFVAKDGQVEVIAERQNYLLFDRMVAFHVQRGVTVPMSASEFYAGLEQRFSERDGMYFLAEQVAEYDKKRMTATEVMQLTLFVTDEASAIQWLKQQLTKKPQSFQDLHPQFMRQIGGWSKHEMSLELRDLLEQNFLVYDGAGEVPSQIHAYLSTNYKDLRNLAKDDPRLREEAADRWYVPDPNKAGDLEKLRERALLREFAEYRESKARKLKVFRLEAVRAGFKKAWGDRDYATILAVAEKIPDAVLQEDPKLLMWYDQALTRSGR